MIARAPAGLDATPRDAPRALAWALAPGTLLAGVAGGIAFPILPVAALRLGLPLPVIGVILAANRATRLLSSPFIGWCADRFGGRRTLLLGLALQVVVLGLYALGIATHAVGAFFMAGRLLHGPASACVFIAAQALALHAGGERDGGRATGAVRAAMVLGVPVGLATGGLLSDAVGDALTFAIAASAVLAATVLAVVRVPELRAPIEHRPSVFSTFRAMRDRRLAAVGLLNLVLNFSAGGMIFTTIALLVHERHFSAFGRNEQGTAGLLMALMIAVDAAATPLAGRTGDRFRAHAGVACGALAFLAGGLVTVGLAASPLAVSGGMALIGLGTAGLGPSLLVLMSGIVPRERRGAGVGVLQFCGDAGGTLGPLVGTAFFAHDTTLPYLVAALIVAASAPVGVWLAAVESRAKRRVEQLGATPG